MRLMEVDLARLPLGALSNKQLELGEAALEAVEAALGAQPRPSASELVRLTSAFYQAIPHAFGFAKPPLLDSAEAVRKKWEMLHTLADIDAANRMQADADDAAAARKGKGKGAAATAHALRPHPVDACYAQLACGLELLGEAGASAADGAELAMLRAYAEQSLGGTAPQLLHAWRADRQGEGARFAAHDLLDNHKLLWHGTNVAVVAVRSAAAAAQPRRAAWPIRGRGSLPPSALTPLARARCGGLPSRHPSARPAVRRPSELAGHPQIGAAHHAARRRARGPRHLPRGLPGQVGELRAARGRARGHVPGRGGARLAARRRPRRAASPRRRASTRCWPRGSSSPTRPSTPRSPSAAAPSSCRRAR
jgi:hypothetical protein